MDSEIASQLALMALWRGGFVAGKIKSGHGSASMVDGKVKLRCPSIPLHVIVRKSLT
jgi:hypothetical protein